MCNVYNWVNQFRHEQCWFHCCCSHCWKRVFYIYIMACSKTRIRATQYFQQTTKRTHSKYIEWRMYWGISCYISLLCLSTLFFILCFALSYWSPVFLLFSVCGVMITYNFAYNVWRRLISHNTGGLTFYRFPFFV